MIEKLLKKIIKFDVGRLNIIDKKIKESHQKTEELKQIQLNLLEFQKKLFENQNKLLSIIDTTYNAIFVIDLDGNVLLWNNSAKKLFGYTFEEIKQIGITSIMGEREKQEFLETLKIIKEKFIKGENINYKKEVNCSFAIHKDKSLIPIKYSVVSWRNNGDVYFTCSSQELYAFNDCFSLKNIYDTIINNINEGVLITDLKFNVIYINEYLLKNILFNSRINLIGKKIIDIFNIENENEFKIKVNNIINGLDIQLIYNYKNNNKEFELIFKPILVKDKQKDEFIIFLINFK